MPSAPPTFCAAPLVSANRTARRRRAKAHVRTCPRASAQDDKEEDGGSDAVISRRVFNAGVLLSGTGVAWVGSRLVVGDDLKDQARKSIRKTFPGLFPRGPTAAERRKGPPDETLATVYFDACAAVAAEQGIIEKDELADAEVAVRRRAEPLFFGRGRDAERPASSTLGDAEWLNFALYARLHVIEERTSPAQRLRFTRALARRTLPALGAPAATGDVLGDMRSVLDVLVAKRWLSGYRLSGFDDAVWREEGASPLTVFAYDPVTIACAQLLGEEAYAEISPVISPWLVATLEDAGISASAEDYYLDNLYRPDPADYTPETLATELDLSLPGGGGG